MAIFIQIPDIPGEAKAKGFEEQIECLSLAHGVSQAATATQSGSLGDANCHHQDMSLSKLADLATPLLLMACSEAKNFPEIVICVTKTVSSSQMTYFKVTLNECILTSVSYSGDGESAPVESITINYAKVAWEYTSVDKTGTVGGSTEGSYDLEAQSV